MQKLCIGEALEQILKEDPRYDMEAYVFVKEALDFTVKMLDKPMEGPEKHVSGGDLLEGIRRYAAREYGPMAFRVLTAWGVKRTEDFGEIVFNLVTKGILGKSNNDQKSDFANGYDFHDAFAKPFLPASPAIRDRVRSESSPLKK
jgi:uncharacterized repeat protein (TIGR04138 family)